MQWGRKCVKTARKRKREKGGKESREEKEWYRGGAEGKNARAKRENIGNEEQKGKNINVGKKCIKEEGSGRERNELGYRRRMYGKGKKRQRGEWNERKERGKIAREYIEEKG